MNEPVLNLADIELRTVDPAMGPTGRNAADYDIRWGEIASRIGARKLGYKLTVVAPGKRNGPFHHHRVEEEMFFILENSGELRHLAVGTHEAPDICEYPDSGKYLVFDDSLREADGTPRPFRVRGRQQRLLDYRDGE